MERDFLKNCNNLLDEVSSMVHERQTELTGFSYEARSLDYYDLHLRKESMHNRLGLPLYGVKIPPLKTSTFLNLFTTVLDSVFSHDNKKQEHKSFLQLAKECQVSDLSDVLTTCAFINEHNQLQSAIENNEKLLSLVAKPKRKGIVNSNFRRVIEKLRINLDLFHSEQPLLNNTEYVNHCEAIYKLVRVVLDEVSKSRHNIGEVRYMKNDVLHYMIYCYVRNNDCKQLERINKDYGVTMDNILQDKCWSIPILVHLITYIYKLLVLGAILSRDN